MKNIRYLIALFGVLSVCLPAPGCRREPEKRYELKGKVVSVEKAQKQVTVAHEEIPGFMAAMTMPFRVGDDWAMEVLAPGQHLEATLVLQGDRSWIEGLRISQTGAAGEAPPADSGPQPGDEVPDFTLLNQDNQPVRLSQYRGRPLVLTFIYTRCPLPDYCPLMSSNFYDIHRALQSLPKASGFPKLLTISFDPEYDTPAVLREYALRYMKPPRFDEWEFATGSPEEIRKITGYFGLTYYPEFDQISHTLVTAIIGPDGRVKKVYRNNRWTPREILAEL